MDRGGFAGAHVPFNARHQVQQPHHAARQAVRIGHAVGRQLAPEIPGNGTVMKYKTDRTCLGRARCPQRAVVARLMRARMNFMIVRHTTLAARWGQRALPCESATLWRCSRLARKKSAPKRSINGRGGGQSQSWVMRRLLVDC